MRVEHTARGGLVTVRHAVEFTPEEMAACHNLYVSLLKSNPNDCAFERAMKKVATEWEIDTTAQPTLETSVPDGGPVPAHAPIAAEGRSE